MTASSSDGAPPLLALPSTERDTAQASAVHSTENVRVPNASTSSGAMEQALSKFKGGVDSFQELINSLLQATQREREELERGRQQLELERSAFEEEATRVQHVLTESETVVLNVGGVKFTTSVTTLRNAPAPSLFNAMFSGRHTLRKDASGCVFIDRDGRHFADILNYLRCARLHAVFVKQCTHVSSAMNVCAMALRTAACNLACKLPTKRPEACVPGCG